MTRKDRERKREDMEQNPQSILNQALRLPPNQRAEVAEQLIQSLDPQTDSDVEQAWQQEIHQRLAEINDGGAKAIPWEEVQRRLTHGN